MNLPAVSKQIIQNNLNHLVALSFTPAGSFIRHTVSRYEAAATCGASYYGISDNRRC